MPFYHSNPYFNFFKACEFTNAQAEKLSEVFATHDIELQQAEDLSVDILTSIGLSNDDAAKVCF